MAHKAPLTGKDKFTNTQNFGHYVFSTMQIESLVKFQNSPQNISGASQQNSCW